MFPGQTSTTATRPQMRDSHERFKFNPFFQSKPFHPGLTTSTEGWRTLTLPRGCQQFPEESPGLAGLRAAGMRGRKGLRQQAEEGRAARG